MFDQSRPKFVVVIGMGMIGQYGFQCELMGIIKKKTFPPCSCWGPGHLQQDEGALLFCLSSSGWFSIVTCV